MPSFYKTWKQFEFTKLKTSMKNLFILLVIIFLGSCTDRTKQSNEGSLGTPISEKNKSIESFDTFYKFYFSDSLNQVSRVRFPLKVVVLIPSEYSTYDTIYWGFKDWSYVTENDGETDRKIIRKNNEEVIINYIGKETGIFVNYSFELINGKWFLVEIIDKST
jgi:hypothetical protein